jgi:DNA-binding transcriptional LysR family regulator
MTANFRYLVASDLLRLGRAAGCRITQRHSAAVEELEETLGHPLFGHHLPGDIDADRRSVVAHARRILRKPTRSRRLVRHRHGTLTSVLRLGIILTLSSISAASARRTAPALPSFGLVLWDLTDNLIDALEACMDGRSAQRLPAQTGKSTGPCRCSGAVLFRLSARA